MFYLPILVLMVLCSLQQTDTSSRCDTLHTVHYTTPCTSCAAARSARCPEGYERLTKDIGHAACRYVVALGDRKLELPGCTHICERAETLPKCCPKYYGPQCLACPTWSGKVCNWHGSCVDGDSGNGTCVCEVGFTGSACQTCTMPNAYGDRCSSECRCVHGECNAGPEGDGECYCQPPYSGPQCDKVSSSCSNCPANAYCKGEGDSAACECLPSFRKDGQVCKGDCSLATCDANAECSQGGGGQIQCRCHQGYEGDGRQCTPVNPCAKNNGGCPANSTVCQFTGPGKSQCVCRRGMEGSNPSAGCTMKPVCLESSCHHSARCEAGHSRIPRCVCTDHEVSDGWRCYGNLMDRVLELDREGSQKGNLTGAIALFEKGCALTLSRHGPFTALIPLLKSPPTGGSESLLCRHHLILGQHLHRDLEGNDFWTHGGEKIRFKMNKQFILMRDPDALFSVVQTDIPAANGIIHLIDRPILNVPADTSANEEYSSKTIADIIAADDRFNRFLSLVDNCGAPMPLRGGGPLTVFVPTNNAIDRFRDGSFMYMLTEAKHKLQEFLRHHMFSQAALTIDQLASMPSVHTMANQVITVNATGDGRIALSEKGIHVETSDIVASNGIIHLIDGVLVPPSIVPILPHRCDLDESKIIEGPCVKCSYLYQTHCPAGTTELDSYLRGCDATDRSEGSYLVMTGCAKYCNTTQSRAECCPGFYGPDCKPCIGGFQHPCYDKGKCFDGIQGNGTCDCDPGFTGVACHICSDPNKHGETCAEDCPCVHGECDNRPGSGGKCRVNSCLEGYSGDLCDKMTMSCDSGGAVFELCHLHAYCDNMHGQITCKCRSGYEGDGHSCSAVNLCLRSDRGGCDTNAGCAYAGPGNVSCVCNEGWTGDGFMCVEINNCQLPTRGGCHENANCRFIGPGQSECECKRGYMGDGIMCDLVNICLMDNGGCHEQAKCEVKDDRTRVCTCLEGLRGNGELCYGSIMVELEGNSEFYSFYRYMRRYSDISFEGNVTALVPSRKAFRNFSSSDENFWFDFYRLPYVLKAHFLEGIHSYESLQQQVHSMVPTKTRTKWEIKKNGEELLIDGASIVIPDIPVIDGYIHVIDMVLRPPVSDLPPVPPTLTEFLNGTGEFSLFRQAALHYNLTEKITSKHFTILAPHDSAVEEYLRENNSSYLGEDVVKYHVIVYDRLFPDHLGDGALKVTLLGTAYNIMFFANSENETLANDVLVDGNFTEVRDGTIIGVSRVLPIHKNHCSNDVFLKVSGRCGACDSPPKCSYNSKPMRAAFPQKMKSNCHYRTRVGKKRKTVSGCQMDCLRQTKAHACCPGYYGHDCFKCPGEMDNWCYGNGKCLDGLFGSGECLCQEGFHGTACETCEPGRFGKDCKSECRCLHGKCVDGVEGNGRCLCYKGWKGVNCSAEIVADACGGICDENANCISGELGLPPTCRCVAGYQGNGTVCIEIKPCAVDNGGCSEFASCVKTSPGERSCTCHDGYTGDGVVCVEIDPCLDNNGGCDKNAECFRDEGRKVACRCKDGFISLMDHLCLPVNPCKTSNGGCSRHAICRYIGPGQRNCTCRSGYKGDGINCLGTVSRELLRKPEAGWFRAWSLRYNVRDLYTRGPFTVFVPQGDYVKNLTVEAWLNSTHAEDLFRYHIVGCEALLLSDLKSIPTVVAASGHRLNFSVQEGDLVINGDAKIISSDECSNGVIHIIDKILIPTDQQRKSAKIISAMNMTAAAEAYGYSMISKLIQNTTVMSLVQNPYFHPLTMFWPTDNVFRMLPEEMRTWLFSPEHQDKLEAYLKAHIIQDQKTVALGLTAETTGRSIHGTSLSFSCDKNLIGDILINGNNAKIVERHLFFDTGVAYGIDQVLEPPDIGARCDGFAKMEVESICDSCLHPPPCPRGSVSTGRVNTCLPSFHMYKRLRFFGHYRRRMPYSFHTVMCRSVCEKMAWLPRCCKNHYGRDCQVCPGGLEAPCGAHGNCSDGREGTGRCVCHPGFQGSACELCEANHYGNNCTACSCSSNGRCDDGLSGDGGCFCAEGWTGDQCETKIEIPPVCVPECHPDAVCLPENQCECKPLYEGNGFNCTAPDLCSETNGGCHAMAECLQTGVEVNCTCQNGHTGDGYDCSPINRCEEEVNGGCSDFATCISTGPNERKCECLPGYVGGGIQCLEKVVPPVDRCLDDNGGCDPKAICKDLHFHTKTAGVFHLRSPKGKYQLNSSDAEAACNAEEAALATFSQLADAQQLGMHLCAAGWMDGKKVGYPIRNPSAKCGYGHVGIVLYKDPVDPASTYDAFCYRLREVSCECGEGYVGDGDFCNGDLASVVATNSNFSLFYTALLRYAQADVKGENLISFLSSQSSNSTVFVPHNDGFSENETLSWRDMEYHISTNNSIHLYEDLRHNTAIESRLGETLLIIVPAMNNTDSTDPQTQKLVNKKMILDWNIPAINGIVHVIQGPLRAPSLTVKPGAATSAHGQSGTTAVLSIFITCLIIGVITGIAYYVVRHKNDAFRFQYFKNDEDDTGSNRDVGNPALVSIPNPLYNGYRAFAEPFGDSPEADPRNTPNLLE